MTASSPLPENDGGETSAVTPPLPPVSAADAAAAGPAPRVDDTPEAIPTDRPKRPPRTPRTTRTTPAKKRAPRAAAPVTPPPPAVPASIAAARFAPPAEPEVVDPETVEPDAVVPETAAPETAEPEVVVPEVVEPEVIDPQVVEPEDVDPQVVEPEDVEPEVVEHDIVEPEPEPEAIDPEVVEPEVVEPDVVEPEDVESDVVESEAVDPDVVEPEAVEPLAVETEFGDPDIVDPEVVEPEVEEPEVVEPEVVEPEPAAVEPEIVEPEVAASDVAPAGAVDEIPGDDADADALVVLTEALDPSDADALAASDAAAAVSAVRLSGVSKSFGSSRALRDVDLAIPAGSFYGIVGPNGAGKTTTLSLVAGLLRPDAGTIEIAGIDLGADPRRAKRQMGILPDRLRTFDRLTGRQLLHYYGVLRGLSSGVVESRTAELARAFDLSDALGRQVSDFSTGMTKKLMLAGAMIHSPRLLVLDEPFESVDPVSSAVILDILGAYVAHGGTVILSSHGMDLVERVCSGVAVIVAGEVLAQGTIDEVRGDLTLEQRFIELSGGISDTEGLEWLHTFSD